MTPDYLTILWSGQPHQLAKYARSRAFLLHHNQSSLLKNG
jgi:hypothetical protein